MHKSRWHLWVFPSSDEQMWTLHARDNQMWTLLRIRNRMGHLHMNRNKWNKMSLEWENPKWTHYTSVRQKERIERASERDTPQNIVYQNISVVLLYSAVVGTSVLRVRWPGQRQCCSLWRLFSFVRLFPFIRLTLRRVLTERAWSHWLLCVLRSCRFFCFSASLSLVPHVVFKRSFFTRSLTQTYNMLLLLFCVQLQFVISGWGGFGT